MLPKWKHIGAKVSISNNPSGEGAHTSEQPDLSANAVLDRMKGSAKLKSDAELAEWLKTSRSTVSKWRKRNAIPYAEAVYLSLMMHASLDYLLTGRGTSQWSLAKGVDIDPDFIRAALLNLFSMHAVVLQPDEDPVEQIALMARGIAHQYRQAQALMHRLVDQEGLSETDARRAAITGMELMSSAGDIFEPRYRSKAKGPQ